LSDIESTEGTQSDLETSDKIFQSASAEQLKMFTSLRVFMISSYHFLRFNQL
jgi:hypothetical protein